MAARKPVKSTTTETRTVSAAPAEKPWGTISLILGIVGVVLPFIGLIPAILAVIFAGRQSRIRHEGKATAGLVLGIVGIAVQTAMIIGFIMLMMLILSMQSLYAGY